MADTKTITLTKAVLLGLAAFALGLLLGPSVDKALFGYSNAAECILDGHGNKFGAHACWTLYPEGN